MKHVAAAAAALSMTGPVQAQERPSVAPKSMQAIAPGLADYTDRVLFGDVWVRAQFSPRDRSMVTTTALIATGKTPQLTGHLNRALDNGVKPSEVAGMVTHLAFYTGWPNAVSALNVIEPVFTERKIDMAALREAAIQSAPAAGSPSAAGPAASAIAPKFAELSGAVISGDLWRRTDLSPRDRSLVTIIALAANGDNDQLGPEIKRAVANGLRAQEIGEAFTHLAFYAGWPKAATAIEIASRTLGTDAGAEPGLRVVPRGEKPTKAPASNFTGDVEVTSSFAGTGGARLGGATVTFQPGAHTNWHTHPLGQLLIVTEGEGLVQAEGEPVRTVKPGDVVWTAPGVRHWHGATPNRAMTHVAVAEALDGKSVTWLEPVTAAQYRGRN